MAEIAGAMNRRSFLRQSFAFSLLAGGAAHGLAVPADASAHHALILGDWGWYDNQTAQTAVAKAMVDYATKQKLKTEALLLLGDSFYGPLPGGAADARWKTQFEDMYPRKAFDCPAYSVMGNHEYQVMPVDKVKANLAYAHTAGTRWTQPALWYSYEFPAKNPLMTVIALDSNMPSAKKREDGVNFTLTPEQQAEQLAWLKAELAKPRRTPFLTVIGHHPVYSNGPHGDHPVLVEQWEPLLREHGVHLYLAGHDHDLQHLEFAGHPTSFVCSGAGGAQSYPLKITEAYRGPYAQQVYGFTHLELTAKTMTLRHVDAQGTVVHGFSKTPTGAMAMLT